VSKKSKTPSKKRRRQSGRPATEELKVEAILVECALAVGRGVGAAGNNAIDRDAVAAWVRIFRPSILGALRDSLSWPAGRPNVLTVAEIMGRNASRLAGANSISKANAEQAARDAKTDPNCPNLPPGSGRWCA
jgi:hypothetical protein